MKKSNQFIGRLYCVYIAILYIIIAIVMTGGISVGIPTWVMALITIIAMFILLSSKVKDYIAFFIIKLFKLKI